MIYINTAPFYLGNLDDKPVTLSTGTSFKLIGFDAHHVIIATKKLPKEVMTDGYRGLVPNELNELNVGADIFNTFFKELDL